MNSHIDLGQPQITKIHMNSSADENKEHLNKASEVKETPKNLKLAISSSVDTANVDTMPPLSPKSPTSFSKMPNMVISS